ncbi:hypothetical protein FGG08_003267 [Glutinoglossum americanum]|uniref:DNA replication factor Cdt1 C-terminal domain-containing protein n=1 Tax=Glutinoglossum americanum TaxID=1670608 RepID=A0A9P8I4P4_9PEZI|nr:hypothetical protein FGG08_003267 [Glutinoglossum americanum]
MGLRRLGGNRMPPAKRRRVVSVKKSTSSALAARNLFPLAKITKAEVLSASDTKKPDLMSEADSVYIVTNAGSSQTKKTESSKRKLAQVEAGEAEDIAASAVGTPSRVSARQITAQISPDRRSRNIDHSHSKEPEGVAQDILKSLLKSPLRLSPKAARSGDLISNLSSPHLSEDCGSTPWDKHGQLPGPLQDLVRLHSSFLTTLSLHHAHNGTLIPADLRLLTPSIGRAWGRRRVTIDDIRRTLGVMEIEPSVHNSIPLEPQHGLKLSDYGNGKICVEMSDDPRLNLSLDKPIIVEDLNTQFIRNLHGHWNNCVRAANEAAMTGIQDTSSAKDDTDTEATSSHRGFESPESVTKFIQSLPMATIYICSSLNKASPLLAKGQKRLEEFKCTISPTKREGFDRVLAGGSLTKDHDAVTRRGNSLLERIRAKELHKSTLPPPLSKAAVHRKSALQRLDEVISVLVHFSTSGAGLPRTERGNRPTVAELPSTETPYIMTDLSCVSGPQRVSLPLATLVVHLKNSLANPISREEAEKCIQLLADEVAPDWVNTVTIGEVTAVIINKGARSGVSGWKDRVEI